MSVRVRLFAGLREAAGAGTVTSEAATVTALLAHLDATYGPIFAARRRTAKVLVDGESLAPDAYDLPLRDGAEVVLLPPFAGGC